MENYRTLKKEIEGHKNKWKHTPFSWIGRINIIKMSILPKAIYRFTAILIKILMAHFTDINYKSLYGTKNNSSVILRKKNTIEGITIPYIKLYYKAAIIKTGWHWSKNRHMDQ